LNERIMSKKHKDVKEKEDYSSKKAPEGEKVELRRLVAFGLRENGARQAVSNHKTSARILRSQGGHTLSRRSEIA